MLLSKLAEFTFFAIRVVLLPNYPLLYYNICQIYPTISDIYCQFINYCIGFNVKFMQKFSISKLYQSQKLPNKATLSRI